MSPESEKQFFAQKPDKQKEVSPEKHQEAIKCAQRIKEISKKENPTEEDLEEVKKLRKRIERIYSPEISFESEKAKERLESLKKTPLWDKEKKQWNLYMNKEQELKDSRRYSYDQLLGVLAEAITGNILQAKEMLESLKNTPLWDKEKKQWNWKMNEKQELLYSSRNSDSQLLGVLAEAITGNILQAKEILESLKKTPLWDKEKKQWNWNMNEKQELLNSDRNSSSQLLGVLAEAITGNISQAKEMLESLKKTPLWDNEKKQWNLYMNEKQGLLNSDRYSSSQLLGILVEAITGNISQAKERLESLKNTPLWDKEKKQWNWYMNKEQELKNSDRNSSNQLLGVLAEAFDEKPEEFVEWFTKK